MLNIDNVDNVYLTCCYTDLRKSIDGLVMIISNRKIFGASSEQVDANQLSLFNESEKFSDSKVEEPTLEEITY